MAGMQSWRGKRAVNAANGTTLLGLLVAAVGRARLGRGPRGLVLATGYRLPLPAAAAFTLGNVVLTVHDPAWLARRPALLRHEEQHSRQYAALGLPMVPAYLLAAAWSYAVSGDLGLRNPFERQAGLADGGYPARRP